MSQNATGNKYRSSPLQPHLNATQLRAVRKELLILRSDVERMELAEAGAELRHAVTRFRWLKMLIPGLSGGSFGQSAKGLNASLSQIVSQYPMLSSLASLVLAKPLRSLLRASAGPVMKWGTLAFAAWEIYRTVKQAGEERERERKSDAVSHDG